MKTWKLLLLSLVPGLWGWLCNHLMAVSLTGGPAFLLTLAFYIQASRPRRPSCSACGWGGGVAAPGWDIPPACC